MSAALCEGGSCKDKSLLHTSAVTWSIFVPIDLKILFSYFNTDQSNDVKHIRGFAQHPAKKKGM